MAWVGPDEVRPLKEAKEILLWGGLLFHQNSLTGLRVVEQHKLVEFHCFEVVCILLGGLAGECELQLLVHYGGNFVEKGCHSNGPGIRKNYISQLDQVKLEREQQLKVVLDLVFGKI